MARIACLQQAKAIHPLTKVRGFPPIVIKDRKGKMVDGIFVKKSDKE